MENLDTPLEELLMRYEAGILTLDEEATLVQKLSADAQARRALVFSFLITGEASRRRAVRGAPAREKAPYFSPAWLVAGVGLASAAALFMAFNLGWPSGADKDRRAMMPAGEDGKDAPQPKEDPQPVPQNDEVKIAELIKQLCDENLVRRDAAEKELRGMGERARKQIEKAVTDVDAERSSRAKSILRGLEVSKALAQVDIGMLKAVNMQADVEYGLDPNQVFKGAYKHAEGGKRFIWESVPAEQPPLSVKKTIVADGTTVWCVQVVQFKTAKDDGTIVVVGRPPEMKKPAAAGVLEETTTYLKVSQTFMENKDLAWDGHFSSFYLPPLQILKSVRAKTSFTSSKSSELEGQSVWVVEGHVAVDQRRSLTFGGVRPKPNGNGGYAPIPLVEKTRMYVAKSGGLVLKAEGLAEDGAVLWHIKLSKVNLEAKMDAKVFDFKPPEGVPVTDGEKSITPAGSF